MFKSLITLVSRLYQAIRVYLLLRTGRKFCLRNAQDVTVRVPEGVRTVRVKRCFELQKIHLPKSVLSLDLTDCTSLEDVDVPPGAVIVKLGGTAIREFRGSDRVRFLDLHHCRKLRQLNLSKPLDSLDLYGCEMLREVVVPAGTGEVKLQGCLSLKRVSLQSVKSLYLSDSRLLETLVVPVCTETLMVHECPRLHDLTLLGGTEQVFIQGCPKLATLEVTSGVEFLEVKRCPLKTLRLPSSVTTLGVYECAELDSISFEAGLDRLQLQACSVLGPLEIPSVRLLSVDSCQSITHCQVAGGHTESAFFLCCDKLAKIELASVGKLDTCDCVVLGAISTQRVQKADLLPE